MCVCVSVCVFECARACACTCVRDGGVCLFLCFAVIRHSVFFSSLFPGTIEPVFSHLLLLRVLLSLERFRGTIFRAKIRVGATDFSRRAPYDFSARRIRVDWLSHEPCFVWRFCVIGCRKIFRVQIWYKKHGFSAGSFISVQIFKIKRHSAGM